LVVDDAGFFAVFAAPDLAALGTFAFTVLVDFTALFVGDFFTAGLAADFFAGFSDSVNALTAFFAKVFTADFTAGRAAFFATVFVAGFAAGFTADFARDVVLAVFFVLLADFATVAFMVPSSLNELANTSILSCRRAIYSLRVIQATTLLSSKRP
jgi:hypothetical protein